MKNNFNYHFINERPQDAFIKAKEYMEIVGLQPIVILIANKKCLMQIQDSILNISKLKKVKEYADRNNLEFCWNSGELFQQNQITIIFNK